MRMTAPRAPRTLRASRAGAGAVALALLLGAAPLPTAFAQPSAARFRGQSVTLNFVNAEIEGVARAMSAILRQQFVVDPRVRGTITLYSEEPLTPREADVLELAADGAPVDEIAARASLSPGTVRNYLSSAITKLGAANRHDACAIARRTGWI